MEPGSRWGKCHIPSAMQTTRDLMCNAQVTQPTGPVGEEVRYTELFLHVLEVVRVLEIHAGPAFLVSACEPSQLSAVIKCSRLREQQARRLRVKVGLAFPRNSHP